MTADGLPHDLMRQIAEDQVLRDWWIGEQASAGLSNQTAKLFFEQAGDIAIAAINALVQADPHDAETIRTLQNEIRYYREFSGWFRRIMEARKAADRTINDEDGLTEDPAPGAPDEGD